MVCDGSTKFMTQLATRPGRVVPVWL